MATVQRGDWVTMISDERAALVGIAKRVSKDGAWVDVDWGAWTKRMHAAKLAVQHTIITGEWSITDEDRKRQLEQE